MFFYHSLNFNFAPQYLFMCLCAQLVSYARLKISAHDFFHSCQEGIPYGFYLHSYDQCSTYYSINLRVFCFVGSIFFRLLCLLRFEMIKVPLCTVAVIIIVQKMRVVRVLFPSVSIEFKIKFYICQLLSLRGTHRVHTFAHIVWFFKK